MKGARVGVLVQVVHGVRVARGVQMVQTQGVRVGVTVQSGQGVLVGRGVNQSGGFSGFTPVVFLSRPGPATVAAWALMLNSPNTANATTASPTTRAVMRPRGILLSAIFSLL
jgi:hypothetical protein